MVSMARNEHPAASRRICTRREALARATALSTAAVAAAAACARAAPSESRREAQRLPPATITWTTWGDENNPMVQASTEGVKLFNQRFPQIKVNNIPDPGCAAVTARIAAGDPPDVMGQCCTCLPSWARKGVLEPLDPYIKRDLSPKLIADFSEVQWNFFRLPGIGQYAMPMYQGTAALLYNKDAFRKRGIALPDERWDWNALREAALRLTDREQGQFGLHLLNATPLSRGLNFIRQNGGHVVDPNDDLRCVIDSSQALEALQWIYDRMWRDNSAIQPAQRGGETNFYRLFAAGRIVMSMEGSWILTRMVINVGDSVDWDVAHFPKGPVQRDTVATTDGWAISKDSKAKEAAWELLKFLQSDEWWDINAAITGQQPTRKSLQDRWVELAKQGPYGKVLAKVDFKPFIDPVRQGWARPVEYFRFHDEVAGKLTEAWNQSIRDNAAGVAESFRRAAREINDQLKQLAAQSGR